MNNPTSLANQITSDHKLLIYLSDFMWASSNAIMAVYESNDFGETAKSDESPVTRADLATHQVLVNGLAELTPGIQIISGGNPGSVAIGQTSASFWLIDPLGGTKEFINRNDEFTYNLALIENHGPTLGFVSSPAQKLLYIGGAVNTQIESTGPVKS